MAPPCRSDPTTQLSETGLPPPESHLYANGVFPVLGGRLTSECRCDHTGRLWVQHPGEDTCPALGSLRGGGSWCLGLKPERAGPSPFLKKQLPPHGKEAGTVHESDAGGGGGRSLRGSRGALWGGTSTLQGWPGAREPPEWPPAVPEDQGPRQRLLHVHVPWGLPAGLSSPRRPSPPRPDPPPPR